MNIKVISLAELVDFTQSPDFQNATKVPITPLRAHSQKNNPNADPDAPVLVIAHNEVDEIIAYFGCLPDRLNQSPLEKIPWSSCWWVDPEKGKAAAMPVFYKALQLWEGKMLFDALPERSKLILEKMNYFSFRKIIGQQWSIRFKLYKALPNRMPALKPFGKLFYAFDKLLNVPIGWRLKKWKQQKHVNSGLQINRLTEVDQSTMDFISNFSENELVKRSADTLNWIIQYPWLSSDKNFEQSYYFSSFANHFENRLLQVRKADQIIGFLWISVRDGVAKLPFCYVAPENVETIVSVLLQELSVLPLESFICFQENILDTLNKRKFFYFHKKDLQKYFGWSKSISGIDIPNKYIQDGDGDSVFT